MSRSHEHLNFWSIAELVRSPYLLPQYERVRLPLVVLQRFDCVLGLPKQTVLNKLGRNWLWLSRQAKAEAGILQLLSEATAEANSQ